MIPFWWLIPAVMIGAAAGILLAALVNANGRDE